VLYDFKGDPDADTPSDVIFDQAGNLYGTTLYGGIENSGTVFWLAPSGGGYTESVIYSFAGSPDGAQPAAVIFDAAGNLYGTTVYGGREGYGTVFELSPSGSGWTEKVLYNFQDGTDGEYPADGVIFDQSGNLYGATVEGGSGAGGTVYELSPSNGSWTLSTLYSFTSLPNGCGPSGSLVMDAAGNLYGTTYCAGTYEFGSVFKLTPTPKPPWTYTSLHDFTGGSDGGNSTSNVTFDASGNLYGTTVYGGTLGGCGGAGCGVVWEITP
jgi:uncharacterized repeat protein (TIGR03803 family)